MNILIQPSSLSLVGSMNHVVINTEKEVSFVLNDSGGNTIVKHLYVPSDANRIEVDLKNIILPLLTFKLQDVSSPYQQSGIVKSFSVTVTETGDGGDTKAFSFTVIRAGVDHFDGDASSFLTQNFLTWQPNVKPVTYYTPEFLTYYAVVAATIRCKAYFEDGTTQTIALAQIAAGECWTVPVQYAVIAGKVGNKLPQYYEVWAENASGSRLTYIQRYVASDMRSEEEEWILFENSLGGIDTFRAYGDSENTAKHTHNVAEIEEDFEEYRVDTTREHKKNTGYLGNRERVWLLDFFPSTGKYAYTDNFIRRIVVTESDVSYNAKELPSNYNFTYKYADARPYLNLPRAELPQKVLNIKIPDLGSFTVAPRLAEFPRLTLSGGALFPVENPYSEQWTVTTAAAILEYIINGIAANYTGNGGIGHTHPNINLLNTIRLAEDYLLANGNKIKAGFADEAKDLSEDSSIWNKFLRKDKEDTANKLITFLEGLASKDFAVFHKGLKTATYDGDNSLNGHGAMVDEDGNGVFQSIFARNFISAPKFVFNEINVTKAEQWNTNAFGTIESVDTRTRQITLHLEENDYGSIEVGDICRGIFADLGDIYKSDSNIEGALDDCNFVVHKGFFTTYFAVEKIIVSRRGECIFQYRKRTKDTPDPVPFMDFAQYGSFTNKDRQSSMYLSSRGHSYIEVLDGVNTWEIQPENRVCRYGWLGNLAIRNDDGSYQMLEGNGLFAQNHVYFGGDIIKLSNISDLDDLQKMAGAYDVSLSRYQGVVTVDDMGNVIGGIYTLSDMPQDDGTTKQIKQWRLSTAVFVRKGQDILLEEDPNNERVTEGHYRVTASCDGCECEIANSTVYITSIKNLHDGVADTEEEIDYDEMRKMERCRVSIVVELEGKTSKTVEFPVRIVHDSLPFLDCDLDNEHASVSWNTKTKKYTGLPIKSVATLLYHNEPWQIDKDSHVDGLPDGLKAEVSFPDTKKMVISITTDGKKTGDFLAKKNGEATITTHNLSIHIIGTYAGTRYEYSKLLTIDRRADTIVYEIIPSSNSIIMDKNKTLSVNSLTYEVWATSSDDKRYKVDDLSAAGLEMKYCKGEGTPNITFGTSVSVNNNDKSITLGLFNKNTNEILDKESVPIVAWGEDGKGVEFIYFRSNDAQTVFDNFKPDEWFADAKYQGGSEAEYISEIQKKYPDWTDDPQGVSPTFPFEYVSVRKSVNGVWSKFSQPAIYATMARSIKSVNTFYAIVEQERAGTKPYDNEFTHDDLTDVVIKDNKGKWLWSADRVEYYDSCASGFLNKTCLGTCENLANVTEQYGVSSDPAMPPTSPYDTNGAYPSNLKEGDCIWSRDHIAWLKGIPTDTTWQFIGKIGVNGVGISLTTIRYALYTNGTNHPSCPTHPETTTSSVWKTTPQEQTDAQPFLWTWTHIDYTDGKWKDSFSVAKKGTNGAKATYYEARFSEQRATVYVEQGYETGYVGVKFSGSFYLVQGDTAAKASDSGLGLMLEFLNEAGDVIVTRTASVTGSLFSYTSSSKTDIQNNYRNQGNGKITSCRYTVTCTDGRDAKSGVVPIGFNAGSVFYHTDERLESLLQDPNGVFSELTQTVDGIYTHVQRLENNMFMGTTTGLGWVLEKTIEKNYFNFSEANRRFSIYNFYPAFDSNYSGAAFSTLRSPIIRVVPGKRYIISFQASVGSEVLFYIGIRYGTASLCNQNAQYFSWNNRVANDKKAENVIVRSKADYSRYFVIFTAASGYDYLQILFINSVDGSSYKSMTNITESKLTRVNMPWPRPGESEDFHFGADAVTVTEYNTVQTTVSNYARYAGADAGYYYTYTKTEKVWVNSAFLHISQPQLEQAFNESFADIEPSEYKEAQNAIESYIKQTADSIELRASKIIFKGETVINDKFWVDTDGNVHMADADVSGKITATSGQIGGFKIEGGGLTNSPFTNDAYVIFRNESHNCFAGIGGNVLPTSSGLRAVARFENEDTNDWFQSKFGYNIAMYISAKNAKYNFAFCGTGHGVLNGNVMGYGYQNVTTTQGSITEIDLSKGNRIFVSYALTSGIALPTLSDVKLALGLGSSSARFALEIIIVHLSGNEVRDHIYGKNNIIHNTVNNQENYWMDSSEYPQFYDNNMSTFNVIKTGIGDIHTIMLYYDGLNYKAFRVSYMD